MKFLHTKYAIVLLLLLWAGFVALRNTVFHPFAWEWWFLLFMGSVCLFRAGMTYVELRSPTRR